MLRELTEEEKIKYKFQIDVSRKIADSYVFGYKKKEMINDEEKTIHTLANGEKGVGWLKVAHCSIDQV